jgi:D-alanyl-D-alanine dipeptidase
LEVESGLILRRIQIDDREPIEIPESAVESYSRPLLLLFASYQLWLESQKEPAKFEIRENQGEVKSLTELQGNSRRSKHWGHGLFQIAADRQLFDVPRGKSLVRFSKLEDGYPKVAVEFRGQPVIGKESLTGLVGLARLLGNPVGREALRFAGIREELNYSVEFADQPFTPELIDPLRSPHYHFFNAEISFRRLSLQQLDQFVIGLKEAKADLSESISQSRKGVIYREVYSVREGDREAFHKQMDRASQAETAVKRVDELSKVLRVGAIVDGEPAELVKVERQSTGYDLIFAFPEKAAGRFFHHFKLGLRGFQPRSLLSFPIVISEPTQRVSLHFKYRNATIDRVGYFVGCRVGPDGARAKPELSEMNRIFSLTRDDDEVLTPGEGAVVFWSPVQRVDRVKLVDLATFDSRLIIAPPYATKNNAFGQQLYPFPRLFLVEETAQRLRSVQDRLAGEGLVLKIWDAYRPPSVQWKMWEITPDRRYVADPSQGSVHSRGCAVDVTLARVGGGDIAMPTGYDDFTPAANLETIEKADTEPARNFKHLRKAMEEAGFEVWENEWWHFNDREWRKYPILDLEPYEQMLLTAGE